MNYSGIERRKYLRVQGRFIVSYRIVDEADNVDITQTKNIGQGGMLLTTNIAFEKGIKLAVEIRLPFEKDPILLVGRVIVSTEISKNLIYDTRLEFINIDEKQSFSINKTVNFYINKR